MNPDDQSEIETLARRCAELRMESARLTAEADELQAKLAKLMNRDYEHRDKPDSPR